MNINHHRNPMNTADPHFQYTPVPARHRLRDRRSASLSRQELRRIVAEMLG